MLHVALVSPHDSTAEAIAARLGQDPAVAACRLVAPARWASPGPPPGREYSCLEGGLEGERVDAVVYRPPLGRLGPDLDDARALFAACRAAGLRHLVLLSSAAVHEPSHHHPGMVPEVGPLVGRTGNRLARAWARLEEMAGELLEGASGLQLTVLRPAPVAAPDAAEPIARLLTGRLAAVPAGFDPTIQLLSREDLAEAVARTLQSHETKEGVLYNVAPAGAVPLRIALRLAGTRRLPVPATLQRWARRCFAAAPFAGPADEIDYAAHRFTVAGEAITRERLGFTPHATSAEAIAQAFGRRPGDPPPAFDDFGMDRAYIARYGRTLFRFLHDWYWRIEVEGLEHVPRTGRAVLTGVHRGFQPWDGVMALHLLATRTGRYPRFLIHPCLVKFPFLANYMTKLGGVVACNENADRLLAADAMVGMFPEGISGAFTLYRDAYRLGRFGRDEFVKMALRHGAPIVPFATVGSAETYPILGKVEWRWLSRVTEWPFLPLTPTFPLLPFPLPSKWHTRFLEPLHVEREHGPEAAADPRIVRAISREVRGRLTAALDEMRRRRRSIFYGSVFAPQPAGEPPR